MKQEHELAPICRKYLILLLREVQEIKTDDDDDHASTMLSAVSFMFAMCIAAALKGDKDLGAALDLLDVQKGVVLDVLADNEFE